MNKRGKTIMKFLINYLFFMARWIFILMIATLLIFGAKLGTLNTYSLTRLVPLALLFMSPEIYKFIKYYLEDRKEKKQKSLS